MLDVTGEQERIMKIKQVIEVLVALPPVLIGHAIGFVWTALHAGFVSGEEALNKCGDDCIERKNKKES